MATQGRYMELARQIAALGAVKRAMARALPATCPAGPAAVLSLLNMHGDMRMGRLSELLAVDTSVTSRHVAHVARHGWVQRLSDPADGRSRILRLTPAGLDMLAVLADSAVHALAHALAGWTDPELDQLTGMLARLCGDFGDCRDWHQDPGHRAAAAVGDRTPADHTPAPSQT
jgi:DNA-binding MarR family transcriptional regulator